MALLTALSLIGIMSAMPEEGELILKEMSAHQEHRIGNRVFYQGQIQDCPVVFALSGIGKVSAAVTAALMIEKFQVDELIFTGTAGGGLSTTIGDIVVGKQFVQHDLDLSPIFSKFYVYSLDKQILEGDFTSNKKMLKAAQQFSKKNPLTWKNIPLAMNIHEGLIASGDQFISSLDKHGAIIEGLKALDYDEFHAVEMEGAAVAQVCHELNKPFVVVRSISDKADEKADHHFAEFVDTIAKYYSIGIIKEYLRMDEIK
jgi:adenosylhomocysteine nucleosidase